MTWLDNSEFLYKYVCKPVECMHFIKFVRGRNDCDAIAIVIILDYQYKSFYTNAGL